MLKDIIEERNKELDKCKICHGNGNNGADDALCLNCGGSGEEQKYSLNDFCIEFKDVINRDPELMSGVRNLMSETAQIVAREVIESIKTIVRDEYHYKQSICDRVKLRSRGSVSSADRELFIVTDGQKVTLGKIMEKIEDFTHLQSLEDELSAEVLPDQSNDEEINIPGFEGTREDLAKISIR
jgi:hypothetical protein